MSGKSICSALLTSFFIVLLSVFSFAQDLDNVTISGKITDSNNAPIVGATVVAVLTSTGAERTVVTNGDGRFTIVKLEPGNYTVKFSAQGFGSKEHLNLVTIAGQAVQLNVSLSPAGVTAEQTISIDDEDATIDITRTVVGGTITSRELEELPNNSRNVLDMVLLLGGTSEEELSTKDLSEDRDQNPSTAPAEQGNFSLSGGTSYSNNITIDGLDNNDDLSAGVRFQPSLESVAEVQVITNQFSSEYGRAAGARINIRTKSGNNRFRGRAFMFFRDDNLNANSWYNNSRGYSRLPLTEYNPGFTLSGPVVLPFYNGRNRTFFSASYEYTDLQDTTFINTWVPVGSNPNYSLPAATEQCPAGLTCVDTNSSTATAILPYTALYNTPNTNNQLTLKLDHRLFKNNDLTFNWQYGRRTNRRTTGASTTRLDDALQARIRNTDAYNITDNWVFGPNTVNQFRIQYSVYQPSYQTDNPFDPVVLIGYRNPETNGSQTLIVGNSTSSISGDSTAYPQNRKETRWQYQDTLTHVAGSHIMKFGFDVQSVRSKALELGDATGTFNFGNVLDFQNNVLSRYRQNFGTATDVTNTYWGVFFNDEFKIRPNLTLNAGLRYERETSVSDNNNFGPRIGIAYSPFKDSKGVIRAGAGIFYNRVLLRTIANFIQNNIGVVPFDTNTIGTSASDIRRIAVLSALSENFPNTYPDQTELQALVANVCSSLVTTLTCNSETGFTINQGSAGNPLRSVDSNLKIPESYQFNVGFERTIGKGFIFEANLRFKPHQCFMARCKYKCPILPDGYGTWTEYLLDNTFTFQNTNGTTRTYHFYLGTNPASNATTVQNGTSSCSNTTNVTCWVNLNSVSTGTNSPSTAVTGSSTNSIGSPIGIALAAIAQFRPNQNYEEMSRIFSIGKSSYKGLVLELRRNYRNLGKGFRTNFRFAYTLSSTLNDGLNNTSNAEVNGAFNNAEYVRSTQDRRHRISVSGTVETPFWLGKLRFSPVFRYGSSAPFNLSSGGTDRNLDDLSTDRISFSGNPKDIVWREPGTPFPEELFAQFSLQPIGSTSSYLYRNVGTGPSFYTFDLNINREFKFGERMRIRPNIEIDNVLNAAVFSFGSEYINFNALSPNASATTVENFRNSFLVPSRTYRQREIRIGLRFDF